MRVEYECKGINTVDQTVYFRKDGSKELIGVRVSDVQLEKLYLSMLARKHPFTARAVAEGS